jgi:hypothetical protein
MNSLAEFEEVGVVRLVVFDRLVVSVEGLLGPVVGEGLAVVRQEGLGGITARECLKQNHQRVVNL